MKEILKEWFVSAPWGRIALVSWGCGDGSPALLVHGREDSAATFTPLLEHLPRGHYVALDLPGHGRSDPLPIGVMLSRMHFITAIEIVIDHLKWDEFVYIAHSMGTELGLFYNVVYPNRIKKFVLLDPGPAIQRMQIQDFREYMKSFHGEYYNNYFKYNNDDRVYSKQRVTRSVMKARGLTEEQAETVLARNITEIGEDRYRISWDRRLKYPAPTNYPTDFYCQLWSRRCPPTLLVAGNNSNGGYVKGKLATQEIISHMEKNVNNFIVKKVDGGHDVHLTHPERFSKDLCEFLNKNFDFKSKL